MVMSHRLATWPRGRLGWSRSPTGILSASNWPPPKHGAAGTRRLPHDHLRLILGEVPAASQAVRRSPAYRDAEPLGADGPQGFLYPGEQLRCADLVDKPHTPLLADVQLWLPNSLSEHPKAGTLAVSRWVSPRRRIRLQRLRCGVRSNSPAPTARCSALGPATFYNGLAQEKLLSRELR